LFFAGLLGATAVAADVPSGHAASLGSNLSFSVADFDGDAKPDLASVQTGKSESARTDYRIQLQLSAAGPQTFQIVAPMAVCKLPRAMSTVIRLSIWSLQHGLDSPWRFFSMTGTGLFRE
jgi:hypothetical protein